MTLSLVNILNEQRELKDVIKGAIVLKLPDIKLQSFMLDCPCLLFCSERNMA